MYKEQEKNKILFPEKVIAVTNRKLCDGDFLDQIRKITDLGVKAVILREKDLSEETYEKLAEKVMRICEGTDTICILHNFPKAAERLGCRYVHLPLPVLQEYMESSNLIVGTSVHSVEQAKEAMSLGVSYVTAGHIFSTQCKPGLAPRGIDFLKNICQTVQVPVYGIGGIHPENMQQVLDAGATGVCMMSEMMTF